jgi:uncharacterized membrane protein
MGTDRLEAFSDGVLAIIITIMVLELQPPASLPPTNEELQHLAIVLTSYVLSFVYVGIYWNNHHHMLRATERVSGGVMWANLHLLFWLSLVPFTTAWMGEAHFSEHATASYGAVMLMSAIAYTLLQWQIVVNEGPDSVVARAAGDDLKGKLSLAFYAAAIALAFVERRISWVLYAAVAIMWLVPDRRVERELHNRIPGVIPRD